MHPIVQMYALLMLVPLSLPVQAMEEYADTLDIREARVTSSRRFAGTGTRVTVFDTLALRENISVSLSDLLTYNSSVFVKQSGRASLSTISFRGTSSSHTKVLWNGMEINSPMLGMTDFSLIPSFLTDQAVLLHGPASVDAGSGGLGGAVMLSTGSRPAEGFSMQYVQGFGSFVTADGYLRISYGGRHFSSSTRAVFSSSRNDFSYVNTDKNENIYDSDMNIIGTFHPVEKNRNGAWLDMHFLQDFRYDWDSGSSLVWSSWYLRSRRQLPQLTVDYGDPVDFLNEQREDTFRSVATFSCSPGGFSTLRASAGYAGTALDYDYARDGGSGSLTYMTKSRSRTNTLFLHGNFSTDLGRKWHLKADLSLDRHFVRSADEAAAMGKGIGYVASRTEASLLVEARWQPVPRAGVCIAAREELYDRKFSPPIPSLSAEYLLSRKGNVFLKASVCRNFRYPTLNDWYFLPGGNPDLKPEQGVSYDAGYSFAAVSAGGKFSLSGEGAWFDSYIDDWILWLPEGTRKNFYTPVNLKKVHAYGVEQSLSGKWNFAGDWLLEAHGNFTWSPSVNVGEPMDKWDESVGKQLVYIPEYSASLSAALSWKSWRLLYKWCWYSDRYTMSSNDLTISGYVPDYFMNDVTLSKGFALKWADIAASLAVRNLFDEDYVTVLSRPMPGINFEVFLAITPKFRKRWLHEETAHVFSAGDALPDHGR